MSYSKYFVILALQQGCSISILVTNGQKISAEKSFKEFITLYIYKGRKTVGIHCFRDK